MSRKQLDLRRFRAGLSLPCLLLLLISPLYGIAADETDASGLALNQALQRAVEFDPELQRLSAEIRSLEADAIAAGQLPDPRLAVGVMNLPVPEFSLHDEPMAQLQLGLSQRFPARAARRSASQLQTARATTLMAEKEVRRLHIHREVRQLWIELQHQHAMLAVEQRKAEVMDQLTETLDDRREADRAYQTAVLSSRARRARLEKTLTDRRAEIARTRAALTEWLDPNPVPKKLEPASLQPPESVAIDRHPEIQVAQHEIEEADRQVEAANAAFKPGWEASFGVGQRFGDTPMGAPSDTLINATVSIDLPLFHRNRQSKRLEAARERVNAATTGPVGVRRQLSATHQQAAALYGEYDELIALYRESVLPLAGDQEEAEAARYRAGRQDLEPVLEARLARLENERELIELELERDRAAIDLLYLGGK